MIGTLGGVVEAVLFAGLRFDDANFALAFGKRRIDRIGYPLARLGRDRRTIHHHQ
jgi:hypothetical protein